MIPNSQLELITTDLSIKDRNCPLFIGLGCQRTLKSNFSILVGREICLEEVIERMGDEEVETVIISSSFKEFC